MISAAADDRSVRAAALLVAAGLLVELPSVVATTPVTFLVFVGAGIPLMAAGCVLFAVHLWRSLVQKGVL